MPLSQLDSNVTNLYRVMMRRGLGVFTLFLLWSLTSQAQLSGTYTVGGSNPNYTTVIAAVAALDSFGISGPVTFHIRPGTYNGLVDFDQKITGSSSTNTILFRTEPNSLTYASIKNSGNALQLGGGVSYITFDSLRIETSLGHAVYLKDTNDHITFQNNLIIGRQSFYSDRKYTAVNDAPGNNTTNLTFTGNRVEYGNHGIYLEGSNVSNQQDGFVIENNVFWLSGIKGIVLRYVKNGLIKKNDIKIQSATTRISGIFVSSSSFSDIIGNKIVCSGYVYDFFHHAIYIYGLKGSSTDRNLIANNMFTTLNLLTHHGSESYLRNCNNSDIVNNSWYGTTSVSSHELVYLELDVTVTFRNNSIFNGGAGRALNGFRGYCTRSNNNLFSTSGTHHVWPLTWQGTGGINVDPGYQSGSTGDLHCTNNSLNAKGMPLSFNTHDFDGQLRDTLKPDIGADEFPRFRVAKDIEMKAIKLPPGPCYGRHDTIWFSIQNEGQLTLDLSKDSAQIDWTVSQASTQSGSFVFNTDTLATGQADTGWFVVDLYNRHWHEIEIEMTSTWDLDSTNDLLVDSIEVIKPDTPSYLPREACYGDTLWISALGGPGTFNWYDSLNLANRVDSLDTTLVGMVYSDTTLYMTETDSNGCEGLVGVAFVQVNKPDTPHFSPGEICFGDTLVIQALGSEKIFTWYDSSSASQAIGFDSSYLVGPVFNDTLLYATQTDSNGCEGLPGMALVKVNPLPVVNIQSPGRKCESLGWFTLYAQPIGGVFSGKGVQSQHFNTSNAGVGIHPILYEYTDAKGCFSYDVDSVTVDSVPVVTFDSLKRVCTNGSDVLLNTGLPSGGNYSGPGVAGNFFDPDSAGQFNLTYTFQDSRGCLDSAHTSIVVDSIPVITFPDLNPTCHLDTSFALVGGSPAGGDYSGPGVNNGFFTPDLNLQGQQVIQYRYTDSRNCKDSTTAKLLVTANPVFDLGGQVLACGKDSIDLKIEPDHMAYLWSSGDSTQVIRVLHHDTLIAQATDTSTSARCMYTDTVIINYDAICLGLNGDRESNIFFKVYPNPSKGVITLEFGGISAQEINLLLVNSVGQQVFAQKAIDSKGLNGKQIDLGSLPNGPYYIILRTQSGEEFSRTLILE